MRCSDTWPRPAPSRTAAPAMAMPRHGSSVWGTTSLMKPRNRLLLAGASSLALHLLALPSPLLARAGTKEAALEAASLRAEYKTNPLGIDVRKPRLSWQLQSGARDVVQSAYQVRVAASERSLRAGRDLV